MQANHVRIGRNFGKYTFVISEEEQEAFWEEFPEHEDSRGIEHIHGS